MPPPPFFRLASCCSLVKRSSLINILRWNYSSTVRSLAYTTCPHLSSDSSSSSSDSSGKYKVINETLEQLRTERQFKAYSFLNDLRAFGFKHDLETYMLVARLLCHWNWGNMSTYSNNLLKCVIDNTNWKVESFEISDHLFETLMEEKLIKAVQVLVEVYASSGRFEEAIHAMSEMKSRSGVMVSTQTCSFVINELIKQDKVDMAVSVYRQMKGHGLIPPKSTYEMLITGHCREGCLEEAWDVFEQMKEDGVEPDDSVYSKYIYGLCYNKETDLAFQFLEKLRESNNKKAVNVNAYKHVIRGYIGESRLKSAEYVFLDMKLRGGEVVPDERCYATLIGEYCKNGDMAKALDLCKEMESRGVQFDHMFVRWMMHSLCDLGMLDEALYVLEHFRQQSRVFLDGVSFNIAIDAAGKLGKADDVVGLVEEMKRRKFKRVVMKEQDLEPTDGGDQEVRDQDAIDYVRELHAGPTQQSIALYELTSLKVHHHDVICVRGRWWEND